MYTYTHSILYSAAGPIMGLRLAVSTESLHKITVILEWINTGSAIWSRMKPPRKDHLSTVWCNFSRVWARSGRWLMRHTKNSHNSTLFHTLLHYARHHTLRSGANTHSQPPQPISISHFFAFTDHSIVSLELPQALNLLPLYTRLRIYIYSLASIRIHMH